MISKHLLAAVLLWSSALPVFSQAPPGTRTEIRLLAFSPDLEMDEIFAQDPAAPPATASVKSAIKGGLNHEFNVFQLMGRKIVFTKKADRESMTREGELVAEVTLPEGVKSAILLAIPPSKDSKALCRILVINDSKRAFPPGSYHVTNLSPLKVRMILEDKNYDFNPSQTVLIEKPPFRPDHSIGMRTFAFKDNTWLQMAASIWSEPGLRRGVLILYPDVASGNVQLRAFDDVLPRAEKEDAAAAAP
ncbi:MAG: hypothetical protein ABIS50_26890 [Luteolibacter sp.]|uniref:hypothetical protein n=1 Tax=Luteolibacter sp. TaxID=1962973 RepID=UPI003262F3C4